MLVCCLCICVSHVAGCVPVLLVLVCSACSCLAFPWLVVLWPVLAFLPVFPLMVVCVSVFYFCFLILIKSSVPASLSTCLISPPDHDGTNQALNGLSRRYIPEAYSCSRLLALIPPPVKEIKDYSKLLSLQQKNTTIKEFALEFLTAAGLI